MTQTAIISGASSGLGLLTGRLLAERGWTVIGTGRDLSAFTDRDKASGIVPVALDFNALANVDEFCAGLDRLGVGRVDALICNAGGQSRRRDWSEDGYEATVAVNYLGQLRLLDRLVDRLGEGSRVVLTASGTHNPDEVKNMPHALESATLDELLHPREPCGPRDGFQRYATSKLCLVRATPLLARDLEPRGVTVNAFDPGLMPGTSLARDLPPVARRLWRVLGPIALLIPGARRPSTSARHLADLVDSPRYQRMAGAYVVDDVPAGTSIAAHDLAAAEALYAATLKVIGARSIQAASV